jgi:hypothetical protein
MWKKSQSSDQDPKVIGRVSERSLRWWTAWRWTERAILTAGFSLLAIHCAFRLEGYLNSRAAPKSFADLELSAPAAIDNRAEDNTPLEVDSLRSELQRLGQESYPCLQREPLLPDWRSDSGTSHSEASSYCSAA